MKLDIKVLGLELSKGEENAILNTLKEVEYYFTQDDYEAVVTVKKFDVGYKVKIILCLADDLELRQEIMSANLYQAIDLAGKKLEIQIRKTRERLKRLGQLNKYHVFTHHDDEEEIENVIRRKVLTNEELDEEDAMMRFEMSGHDFFIYRDIESGNVNILYQRKTGGYGVIEVE